MNAPKSSSTVCPAIWCGIVADAINERGGAHQTVQAAVDNFGRLDILISNAEAFDDDLVMKIRGLAQQRGINLD